jgi:formiminoglutamase
MMLEPTDPALWQGREDIEDGTAGYRWHQKVQFTAPIESGVALLGLASDLGVTRNKGRAGASQGPAALRRAMANQAWHAAKPLFDAGSVTVDTHLAAGQQVYADEVSRLLKQGHFVLGLGGGHEIGWASYQGVRQWVDSASAAGAPNTIGIVNFDAHFDLRQPAPDTSSGTPFRQVAEHCQQIDQPFNYACIGIAEASNTRALFDVATAHQVAYTTDLNSNNETIQPLLRNFLNDVDYLYVTICLDVLPAAIAPGVSAPAAFGIAPHVIVDTLHWLAEQCQQTGTRWVMADIAELSPPFDIDHRTAKLAARLAFEIVQCIAK